MRIDDWNESPYRDPSIIKEYEKKTFQFLSSNPRIIENFPELSVQAKLQYDALLYKNARRHNIDFQSFLDLTCVGRERRDLRVHVGSNIKNDLSFLIYYLSVGTKDRDGKYSIRRSFHFDYQADDIEKPVFHLQYGGKMPIALEEYKEHYDSILFPQLSEPRFYSTPMTLAILLNKLFKEFICEDTYRIVEDSDWKGIVAQHEKTFLKPYFEHCLTFFSRCHKASCLFTTDFCYGLTADFR